MPIGPVPSGATEVTAFSLTVELTDAQIKALPTTPVDIVPAAGAGRVIEFNSARMLLDVTAGGYTDSNVNSKLGFFLGIWRQSGIYDDQDQGPALSDPSDVHALKVLPIMSTNGNGAWDGNLADTVNQPLKLHWISGNADLTDGNAANTLKVTVLYTIIDV